MFPPTQILKIFAAAAAAGAPSGGAPAKPSGAGDRAAPPKPSGAGEAERRRAPGPAGRRKKQKKINIRTDINNERILIRINTN